MLKIGITGGIGCGKSEVCKLLRKAGIPIISADRVARKLINSHTTIKSRLIEAFGKDIYQADGTLDRKKVAGIIFSDETAKRKINEIVHPFVIEYQQRVLNKLEHTGKFKIAGVEAALIFEAGSHTQFDVIIVVAASRETVLKRLKMRDGLSEKEIIGRMNSQMPLSQKIKKADYVIENDGTIDELKIKVEKFLLWLNDRLGQQQEEKK